MRLTHGCYIGSFFYTGPPCTGFASLYMWLCSYRFIACLARPLALLPKLQQDGLHQDALLLNTVSGLLCDQLRHAAPIRGIRD